MRFYRVSFAHARFFTLHTVSTCATWFLLFRADDHILYTDAYICCECDLTDLTDHRKNGKIMLSLSRGKC